MTDPPDFDDPVARVDALLQLGKAREAIRVLRAALVSDPGDPELLTQLAWAYHQAGQVEAVAAAESAIAADPEDGWPYQALAWARWELGDQSGALEAARTATRLDPENGYTWSAVAFFAGRMGHHPEAQKAGLKATALEPESADVWLNAGSFGATEDDLDAQRRSLELSPESSMPNNNYGYELLRRGECEESIPFFERALALDPTNRRALRNLGIALRWAGREAEGREAKRRADAAMLLEAEAALERDPKAGWALVDRGWILLERGQRREALSSFRRACRHNPENGMVWRYRIFGELALGHVEEARQAAAEHARLEHDSADGLAMLADVAVVTGDLETARTAASELSKRFPKAVETIGAEANAALAEGDLEHAEQKYREVLAREAVACGTHSLLGVTLARSGDVDGARESLANAKKVHDVCVWADFLERELAAVKPS